MTLFRVLFMTAIIVVANAGVIPAPFGAYPGTPFGYSAPFSYPAPSGLSYYATPFTRSPVAVSPAPIVGGPLPFTPTFARSPISPAPIVGGPLPFTPTFARAVPAPAAIATPVARAIPAAPAIPVAKAVVDHDPYPQYSFAYSVQDSLTGDSKAQEEVREGGVVKGSYSLIEPDGTRRVVNYYADPVNGFNAVVHRDAPSVLKVAPVAAVA